MSPTAIATATEARSQGRDTILIVGTIVHSTKEIQQLQKTYTVIQCTSATRQSFIDNCKPGGEYDNVLAIYRHNDSAKDIGIFDKELINALPSSLKYICHNGAGYDQIDINAATSRGIKVSHTPGSIANATATTAMWLIITSLRRYLPAEANVRKGLFKQGLVVAHDPENKVLGIIGMGGIGTALAARALGFGMRVQYHNRRVTAAPNGVKYIDSMNELLSTSDVISLNLPLNEKTRGIINKDAFANMKKGVVLVNTARGGVINQEAMYDALTNGTLATVGLDVYPDEPNIDQRLIDMATEANGKVVLLPHMGTETVETQHKMEVQVLDNIVSALQGKGLLNQVPEQVS